MAVLTDGPVHFGTTGFTYIKLCRNLHHRHYIFIFEENFKRLYSGNTAVLGGEYMTRVPPKCDPNRTVYPKEKKWNTGNHSWLLSDKSKVILFFIKQNDWTSKTKLILIKLFIYIQLEKQAHKVCVGQNELVISAFTTLVLESHRQCHISLSHF
jgi:hypothetical protein